MKNKNREYNKKDLLVNKRSDFPPRRLYLKFHGKSSVTMKKYKKERYKK